MCHRSKTQALDRLPRSSTSLDPRADPRLVLPEPGPPALSFAPRVITYRCIESCFDKADPSQLWLFATKGSQLMDIAAHGMFQERQVGRWVCNRSKLINTSTIERLLQCAFHTRREDPCGNGLGPVEANARSISSGFSLARDPNFTGRRNVIL